MIALATAPADLMRAFDALPKELRRTIAAADFPYHPAEIAARLEKGRSVRAVLREIEGKGRAE